MIPEGVKKNENIGGDEIPPLRNPHNFSDLQRVSGKQAAFYIPINFDPNDFPEEERYYACYFLNLLHWRYVCRRADGNGFVHVKWEYLTRIIPDPIWGRVWRVLMDDLRKGGPVVECDQISIVGVKSRGYRLARDYRRVRRIICTDEKLNRKIRVLSLRQDAKLLPVHYWLKSHFVRLHFDGERAASIIATLTPDDDCKLEVEEYRLMLTGYCQRIADGEHRLSCDRFGRVHTHITSLKKELRSCLSVDGQPIVGWDLANSQPLIAGLLARRFCRSPSVQSRMSNATFKDENNPYCYKALAELTHHSSVKDDVQEYLRCCEEGAFYESFGDDREKVKKGFMSILMGPIKYKGSVKADFNNKFPTVATMLHSLKLKDYRRVAWLLQNLEATIFIHRVCGRLMDEHPKLPVYTIHDSIYTIPRGRNIIKRVILEEFDRFGIVPTLKHC